MIRMIAVFLILTVMIGLGIKFFQTMSLTEKWKTVKIISFSAGCALVATLILVGIVVVF